MTATAFAAILLFLLGVILSVPLAVFLAIVVLLLEVVHAVWARWGLRGVGYERRLERSRIAWGDETTLTIEAWNRQRLPLAWLRADDDASRGVVVRERELGIGDQGQALLRNAWTLAPFERVTRRFHVGAVRRGVHELGPVELSVGDLFAREAASEPRPGSATFLVRPRVVPATALQRRDAWDGLDRVRSGLTEDPARYAGVRDYAPGDPIRRIHGPASARLGRPVVKRFEPSRDREVLLALDLQTVEGPAWDTSTDEDAAEALIVVAASLARSLAAERAAFGLAAAGYSGVESRFALLPVAEGPAQAERVLDLLARLSSHPSAPFERLLAVIGRVARPGTTVAVITSRDPAGFGGPLRRLERSGRPVVVIAAGPDGASGAARARRLGLAARAAALDGPWRTASRLTIAG